LLEAALRGEYVEHCDVVLSTGSAYETRPAKTNVSQPRKAKWV
jgi:hypothetical protein